MKPNQIDAVLGLHRISEYTSANGIDNQQNVAYQIGFKNIVVHENYDCSKPDNDIGMIRPILANY